MIKGNSFDFKYVIVPITILAVEARLAEGLLLEEQKLEIEIL
jgi:hypothetical protein